jgi:S-ribosylhomocysteine lyase LuxS involved in autoinducer biosynthesis
MEAALKKGFLEIDQECGSKLNHSLLQAKKLNRQLGDGKVSD